MKVLKATILFLTIGLLAGACADNSDLDFPSSFPTVFVEEGTNFDLQVGKVLQVYVNIESETIMESMEVYKNGNLFQRISLEPSYNLKHQYQFQGIKEDAGLRHTLTFVVIDRDGVGAAESIEVLVYETPLTFTTNASISNANGNGLVSWDLVLNEGKTVTNKIDILNSSTAINGWVKGWKTSTLTQFAKVNTTPIIPFNQLTLEDITALFQQNTIVSEVSLATGDWLVAKIRDSEEYAIIEITHVDEQFDNATERIDFVYKKTSEFAGR